MWKKSVIAFNGSTASAILALAGALFAPTLLRAADLTAAEQRWLQAAWPVVEFARREALPLDVVVQPQAAAGLAPLAMGFAGGRCKLVLSMRGNAEADATLERTPPELHDAAIALMAAHELGHCRRHLDGQWLHVPSGFSEPVPASLKPEQRPLFERMRAQRREEAYADLVGLAWVAARLPQHYARLHAWLLAERERERVPGSHHDTLAWLRLPAVASPAAGAAGDSIFSQAQAWWSVGLAADDD